MFVPRKQIITVAIALIAMLSSASARMVDGSSAGTVISNRAEATYEDGSGVTYKAVSETVTLTIATVAGDVFTGTETGMETKKNPAISITKTAKAIADTRIHHCFRRGGGCGVAYSSGVGRSVMNPFRNCIRLCPCRRCRTGGTQVQ